jgi:hypothetical protein
MTKIISLFNRYNESSLLLPLLFLVLLAVGWFLVYKSKNPWRKLPAAILLLLTIRLFMFGNPLIWLIYAKLTDPQTIDQRLSMTINYKNRENQKIPPSIHYLAIGTSQVNALFHLYIKDHAFVTKKNLAGLLPCEYFLCNSFVQNTPDTLILYLSEADFCKMPNYTSLYMLPEQYLGWYAKFRILQENYPGKKHEASAFNLMLNDCFPEFKYRMVVRHIALNLLHLDYVENTAKDVTLKSHLVNLQKLKDDGLIDYHMATFSHFLDMADKANKTVIICEGTMNPLALSAKNKILREKVRERFLALEKRYHVFIMYRKKNNISLLPPIFMMVIT